MVNPVRVKVISPATNPVDTNIVLRNTTSFTQRDFRLDKLKDVSEPASPASGDTLVYNSANDTYVVQKLALSQLDIDTTVPAGDIDGGTF